MHVRRRGSTSFWSDGRQRPFDVVRKRSGRSALANFEFQCIWRVFICFSFDASLSLEASEWDPTIRFLLVAMVLFFILPFLPPSFLPDVPPPSAVELLSNTSPHQHSTHTNIGTPRAWHLFSRTPPRQCTHTHTHAHTHAHIGRSALKHGYFAIYGERRASVGTSVLVIGGANTSKSYDKAWGLTGQCRRWRDLDIEAGAAWILPASGGASQQGLARQRALGRRRGDNSNALTGSRPQRRSLCLLS